MSRNNFLLDKKFSEILEKNHRHITSFIIEILKTLKINEHVLIASTYKDWLR